MSDNSNFPVAHVDIVKKLRHIIWSGDVPLDWPQVPFVLHCVDDLATGFKGIFVESEGTKEVPDIDPGCFMFNIILFDKDQNEKYLASGTQRLHRGDRLIVRFIEGNERVEATINIPYSTVLQ